MDLVLLTFKKCHLKGNPFDFLVDYNFINKSDILNMHKYLMVKDNIK